MGICKCSKKRVTQQFCFEHRVNVCEFCMINSHPSCIVQPYLQWLEDSSYKSKCSFCQLNLSNEECVRLLCYHVFHWTCLNKYCSSLPSNTAPAGYCCCDCNTPIFPSSSTPSPIYATLKKKLSTTQWARIGLGLPINSSSLSVDSNSSTAVVVSSSENQIKTIENSANLIQQTFDQKKNLNSNVFIVHHNPESQTINSLDQSIKSTIPVSVNNVSNYLNNNHNLHHTNHNNFSSFNASTRKIAMDSDYSTRDRDRLILDIDDDKYRHRSALDRLSRNFKLNIKFLNYKLNLNANQRLTILICFIVLILFTIFYYLVKQAREADDPLLDPRYNPNIHIQDVDNFN